MPIRRLGLLVSAPIGATEPPNQPSCYPTPILLRGIDHLRDLAPPPPTIDAGPDAPPLRSNWRRRQNIRRIGGAGTAARRPVGWRREGRARGRSTEAGEGRFRGKTTMAVHRPRNNWNGATPKTRAPPDGVSTRMISGVSIEFHNMICSTLLRACFARFTRNEELREMSFSRCHFERL